MSHPRRHQRHKDKTSPRKVPEMTDESVKSHKALKVKDLTRKRAVRRWLSLGVHDRAHVRAHVIHQDAARVFHHLLDVGLDAKLALYLEEGFRVEQWLSVLLGPPDVLSDPPLVLRAHAQELCGLFGVLLALQLEQPPFLLYPVRCLLGPLLVLLGPRPIL